MSKWRICWHWTGGIYKPSLNDLAHYHIVIDHMGTRHKGRLPIEANRAPLIGDYIAHCGGGNSNTIGIAVAAMAGYKDKWHVGEYPITPMQFEALMAETATLCKRYDIPITEERVYSHYEFGQRNPRTTSYGKIDVTFIPSHPGVAARDCGDFMRGKAEWYLKKVFPSATY